MVIVDALNVVQKKIALDFKYLKLKFTTMVVTSSSNDPI